MDDLKVGDVVGLRSGGCRMTVTEVKAATTTGDSPRVLCEWFEDTDYGGRKHASSIFPVTALRKVAD